MDHWEIIAEIDAALAEFKASGFDTLIRIDGKGAKHSFEREGNPSPINTAAILRFYSKYPSYFHSISAVNISSWTNDLLKPALETHVNHIRGVSAVDGLNHAYYVSQIIRAIPLATFDVTLMDQAVELLSKWLDEYTRDWLLGKHAEEPAIFLIYLAFIAIHDRLSPELLLQTHQVALLSSAKQISQNRSVPVSEMDITDLALSLSICPRYKSSSIWDNGIAILNEAVRERSIWKNQQLIIRMEGNYNAGCSAFEACCALMAAPHYSMTFDSLRESLLSHLNWLRRSRRMGEPWLASDLFLREGVSDTWFNCMVVDFLEILRKKIEDSAQAQLQKKYHARKAISGIAWGKVILEPTAHQTINEKLIEPLRGRPLGNKLDYCTAILFGPPGTAKTTIAETVAQEIGWSFIELGVSEFLSGGLDNVFARSIEIFRDIERMHGVVVLLDELEGLFAERGKLDTELTQKFLTSALLPPLKRLRDRSRIILFIATNHIKHFDEAVSRPGRIDLIIGVGPPNRDQIKTLLVESGNQSPEIAEELSKRIRIGTTIGEIIAFKRIDPPTVATPEHAAMEIFEKWDKRIGSNPQISDTKLTEYNQDKGRYERLY